MTVLSFLTLRIAIPFTFLGHFAFNASNFSPKTVKSSLQSLRKVVFSDILFIFLDKCSDLEILQFQHDKSVFDIFQHDELMFT